MSSEQFQSTYESIYSTGTRLLQYLREIEQGRRSEGNNSEGLHSIEDELNKALEALQAQKYQVAVIAAMKAGKSTFLIELPSRGLVSPPQLIFKRELNRLRE